ncbi:hypothetical protein AB832_04860 [Flavobacteriaceae bacterium (ex Bugula neritina AB1)]|nr:hypothetical protein AB832_04860 [Flavobacteriaceae bacterium (ex Bugula neritina AB1)]
MIVGYALAIALAVIAFWVIYRQLSHYSQITENKNDNNEKLFLVGEAITGLYEAESLTRNIIQTSDIKKFENYKTKIDSIINTIDKVGEMSDTLQAKKVDSIKVLIDSKNKNLKELINIYKQRKEKGIYATAIDELKKANESFRESNYDRRFRKLTPEFKSSMVNILNILKEDNAKRLTNQTADSLAKTVKQVLADLEKKDKKYKREISLKENKLLKNDQIITKQLRDLMASIEDNERKKYLSQLQKSDAILNKTSNFIIIITIISLLTAIIFLFLITKDVSMSQRYRNELEAEKIYKESLLKTRESLINTVTHDLRSPLNTVIGYSDLLEKTGLNNKQKHYLGHLKKSSDYILHLVNDLLDLSKLEAGRMIIEELPFSPQKLIENTISSVIPINDKKNLDIVITSEDLLKKQFLGDPFRIKQILTNLVNNAYKFTDNGSIIIDKLLRGTITLDSEPGKGSNFTFCIPIKLSNSQISEEEKVSTEVRHFSNKKVLIVDDDPSQLDLTSEVVSLVGLSYDISHNGLDAVTLLKENVYDLVLTDIQMPKMDGFELLKAIRNNPDHNSLQVIALSGRTDTSAKEYLRAGFYGSLRKPYAPKALIDLIGSVLKIDAVDVSYDCPIPEMVVEDSTYSLSDLMLFAHGDSDSLYAILDTFHESTIKNLNELRSTVENEDFSQIKKLAHKMLPMFKQIKAKEIIPILDKLEHQGLYSLDNSTVLKLANEVVIKIENLMSKLKVEN